MPEDAGGDQERVQFVFSKDVLARLEADYQDRMNIFRANVVKLLSGANALHHGEGWAVFSADSNVENRHSNPAINGGFKDILVMLASSDEGTTGVAPSIRILTNESYKTPDGLSWLTQDFSCDREGDSQYFVDACNPQIDPRFRHTQGVFFVYEDDNLVPSNNLVPFTPYFEIVANVGEDQTERSTKPFGHYQSLEDRVCALDYGISLLAEIASEEPYARMTKAIG